MINKKFKAFSLIELLISLIIISLLIAAFTPLITKKMKASDITVGSFGGNKNNGDGTQIERNVTRDDCTRLNAVYVSAEETGDKPICVMKYHIGDGAYNESFEDVQICSVGSNCTISGETKEDLTPTCWQGNTARISYCNANYGGYSGCNRTVCNWTGANKLCENIGWRLPTIEELESFTNEKYSSSKLANNGLMFCGYNNSTTAPWCSDMGAGCIGSHNGNCYPSFLWSSSLSSESIAYNRYLGDNWGQSENSLAQAFSARCVLDTVTETIKEVEKEVEVEKPTTPAEAPSEEFCAQFDAMFIPAKWSGSTDLCVTKYNVGDVTSDGSGPPIVEGSDIYASGLTCSSNNCCWKGRTSDSCTENGNGDSTYSGCNRTMCQWGVGSRSCIFWTPKGMQAGYWRLPTNSEVSVWGTNLNNIQKNKGKDGLQLCDTSNNTSGSVKCANDSGKCLGSLSNMCLTNYIWTSTPYSSGNYLTLILNNGNYSIGTGDHANRAAGTRCVYDGKKPIQSMENINKDKQAICNKYNALYVPAKYNGTSDDLCVTKYNAGDDGGPVFSNYTALGITMIASGINCTTGKCCWQGKTTDECSVSSSTSTYSGCNRTMCQWQAANIICNNWNPDGDTIGKWRLPTDAEVAIWGANIRTLSLHQGISGLQLCDGGSASYGGALCKSSTKCQGAAGSNACLPHYIWTSTPYSSSNYLTLILTNGGYSIGTGDHANRAAGVRCVSSEVLK